MSCSKLFSGDLPELTNEIIKNFQNDYSTLYSCVLVNRLWCRLAIPLLWENPFSIPAGNYNFIEVYLYNLNDCLKSKLNEYQIIDHYLSPLNTLFNYPSFIRYLSMCKIASSIDRWLEANDIISKFSNRYSESIFEFKRLIELSLIELFIENEANLHTFEIKLDTYRNKYCDNILESILQNPNFINNTRNLKTSLFGSNTPTKNRISQIINSHQNLKKMLLGYMSYDTFSLYQSLLLSKESNCSNTLNTIIFYYIDFKGIISFAKVFENLNVLESVHIIYCFSLNSFTQQIINLTKPFKLKSLFINGKLQIDSLQSLLQSLLQKSGNYLENFGFGVTIYNQLSNQQILELIIKYCRNIKFLDLYKIETHITSLVFSLIENIKQNLNYLSTSVGNCQDSNIELILQNLGQTLPSKLEYLSLVLYYIKANDFGVFLKNSQDTFFKKLLINNMTREYNNDIDILPYIKEYIMKKKRVKYLAIKNTSTLGFNGNDIDLSNLKDEVKEFKSHNIKVQSYINLSTNIYNFVNEID
ncbi:hypothetical protein RhiirA1_528515 [Rhizophagus irregularis]|uniref:F-box domain-containing protein n=1 Tax=Rhizophagus irregularis TaxID=588596 RepID=A0A2N0SJQ7_9GLOM|nr:hypothetical protein RhiirA1_528515 [Rhizophagus irregularis]